jgi:hypothetical protein
VPTLDTVVPRFETRLDELAVGVTGVTGVTGVVGVPPPSGPPPAGVAAWLSEPPLEPQPVNNAVSNTDAASTPFFFNAFMIYLPF